MRANNVVISWTLLQMALRDFLYLIAEHADLRLRKEKMMTQKYHPTKSFSCTRKFALPLSVYFDDAVFF